MSEHRGLTDIIETAEAEFLAAGDFVDHVLDQIEQASGQRIRLDVGPAAES